MANPQSNQQQPNQQPGYGQQGQNQKQGFGQQGQKQAQPGQSENKFKPKADEGEEDDSMKGRSDKSCG